MFADKADPESKRDSDWIIRWSASVTAPELCQSAPFRGRTRPPFTFDSERRCRL